MSRHKKDSLSYTIPVNDDSDDEEEMVERSRVRGRKKGFSSMSNTMGDINSMINSMVSSHCNMFGGMDMMGRRGRQNQLMPFGFPNMNDIFESFQFNTNDPNGHSFSSSTFMTMSSGPDGRPQVYQASQSTRTAPGGIRETKKSVCDSRTGTKKMAIGHHIGDRSHVMEREQNIHSGREEERQEFINLDEEEAEEFNREWETKTRASMNAISYGGSNHRSHSRRPRDDLPAIQDSTSEQTTERAKKRYHVEHVISSDEEEEVVVKKSHKGARPSSSQTKKN